MSKLAKAIDATLTGNVRASRDLNLRYTDVRIDHQVGEEMRYFSFNEYDENGGHVETLSEEDIRKEYWPYWYNKMCERFGQAYVDTNYTFYDCIDDWMTIHWAWEVKE